MPPLAPSTSPTVGSEGLVIGNLHLGRMHEPRNQRTHEPLLLGDAADGIDDFQPELVDDPIILVQHLALKQAKTLDGIAAPAQVYPRLVELEFDAPGHEAVERHLDRHAEI